MILNFRRKILFFIGIFLTGLLGILSGYIRTNYSKNNSLIVPKASADVPSSCGWCGCPWYDWQCNNYYSCFPANTLVSTPSGDKNIQDLIVGDLVYGFNIETGKTGEYPITETFKHGRNDANSVYSPLVSITHAKGSLVVTDNHLIYRRNGRMGEFANFDRAGVLQIGDMLTLEDGKEVAITGIENGPEYDFVYNLEVKDVHTYFASGVRVHNTPGPGDCVGSCCGSSGGGK